MSYNNRMMVTPRSGCRFETPDGLLTRGRSVPADHPLALANRGAFMNASDDCRPLVESTPKKKAKKVERFIGSDEASD